MRLVTEIFYFYDGKRSPQAVINYALGFGHYNYEKINRSPVMKSFLKAVKDIVVYGLSLTLFFSILLMSSVGVFFAVINWPFYSYEHLSSFVSAVHSQAPVELEISSFNLGAKPELDNFVLASGKLYCGAKTINQHVALDKWTTSYIDDDDMAKDFLKSIYQDANMYLCPTSSAKSAWSDRNNV
ncbi:hypothetical protein [Myxosarcina sp. GI1]|uniref:hypothetical protein n=1 Tax=Myxosarcina sp. GI1 TaxID=1541065 RepID=UPI0012DFE994|nr:hypothetical protein [Myxosarcina sp. GI1]